MNVFKRKLLLGASLCIAASTLSAQFVSVSGTNFMLGGKPYYFAGSNTYDLFTYGPGSGVGDDFMDKAKIDAHFANLQNDGVTVLRLWIFSHEDWHGFEKTKGVYNEPQFTLFDYIIKSAKAHDVKLVPVFENYWEAYGGIDKRLAWEGVSNGQQNRWRFFNREQCPGCFDQYKSYVKNILNRVNTFTGVAYKDDPTIFAWDLMNEPRYEGATPNEDKTGTTLRAWVDEMGAYVKSIDPNHLVFVGLEGHGTNYGFGGDEGNPFVYVQQSPYIDMTSAHPYPTESWANLTMDQTKTLIRSYISDSHNIVGKPFFMSEWNTHNVDRSLWWNDIYTDFETYDGDGSAFWWYEGTSIDGKFGVIAGAAELAKFKAHSAKMAAKSGFHNVAPSVTLSSPADGATFTAPASITLTANATDSDGKIASVAFYNGATLLGIVKTASSGSTYTYAWSNVQPGSYPITAQATDDYGATSKTSVATLTVNYPVTLSATTASFTSDAGTASIQLTSRSSWTATSNQSWLTLSPASGTGNGTLVLSALANADSYARAATVTVTSGGLSQTIAVTQAGQNFAIGKTVTASSVEGTSTAAAYAVDGNMGTRWSSAYSDPQWIMVDLGTTQQINKVVLAWETAFAKAYQVQVSNDGSSWTTLYSTTNGQGGTESLNVSGSGRYVRMYGTSRATQWGYSLWEFQVSGTAGQNTLSVTPSTASVAAAGGTASVAVASNTSWTASSNQAWLTTSASSGTGNASLALTAAANTTSASRSATVTFAGGGLSQTVVVSQDAPSNTLSVTPTSASLAQAGGSTSLSVFSNVAWTATSDQSWLTITPATGSNHGSITVTAAANTATAARTANVTVTGGGKSQVIAISQSGQSTTLSVTPTSTSIAQAGGTASLGVSSNTTWTASSDQSWLTVSPALGSNNGSLSVTALAHTGTTDRTASVTVAGGGKSQVVTVIQPGKSNSGGPATITTSLNGAGNAWFMEEFVKVATTAPVTAMTLKVTIAKTTGVNYSGMYDNSGRFTRAHADSGSSLVYTFALNSGITLDVGSILFANQLSLGGNVHPTTGDAWVLNYVSGGVAYLASGTF